jgi:hypothetical protein
MIKKLIWLAVLAGIGYGVYAIGPYVAQKYRAYMAEETAKMAVQVNQQAQDYASPASNGALRHARDVQRKVDESDRGQE